MYELKRARERSQVILSHRLVHVKGNLAPPPPSLLHKGWFTLFHSAGSNSVAWFSFPNFACLKHETLSFSSLLKKTPIWNKGNLKIAGFTQSNRTLLFPCLFVQPFWKDGLEKIRLGFLVFFTPLLVLNNRRPKLSNYIQTAVVFFLLPFIYSLQSL